MAADVYVKANTNNDIKNGAGVTLNSPQFGTITEFDLARANVQANVDNVYDTLKDRLDDYTYYTGGSGG
jgi:hypothetical protein